jgi:threonine/homoserine/homoserine lactone efflux protein
VLVLIVIPGPTVLFVVSCGVVLARRAALAIVAGNVAGVYLQVVGAAYSSGSASGHSGSGARSPPPSACRCSRGGRPDLP